MQLHDIFPTVEVVEYSLYWLLLYFILSVIALSLLWKYFRRRLKRVIPYYLVLLEGFDVTHAKKVAYWFGYYGHRIVKTDAQKQILHTLIEKLKPYKYLQDDVMLPDALSNELRDFLQTIRHENV